MRTRAWVGTCSFYGFAVFVVACESPLPHEADQATELQLAVTGVAAESIDPQGRFVLSEATNNQSEISAQLARELAVAYWHDARTHLRSAVSNDRGAEVAVERLKPCGRVFLVASAYHSYPDDLPVVIRKAVGSHWLVPMCAGNTQEVVISVSTLASDAETGSGTLRLMKAGAGNFFVMGVPVGAHIPQAPEQVAVRSYDTSNERVIRVPELIMRPFPHAPTTAVWHVEVESPVELRGTRSSSTRRRSTFFAGALAGWQETAFAAADALEQSNSETAEVQVIRGPGADDVRSYTLNRRADVPALLEIVSFKRER